MILKTGLQRLGPLLLAIPLGLAPAAAIAGNNSTNLPNGAELAVSIDDPVTSTEFKVPASETDIDVDVEGTASIGLGDPDATLIYVIDTSGSTGGGSGTGCAPVLTCEKQFFIALNNAAITDGSTDLVAVVNFGNSAATPLGLTAPTNPSVNATINGLTAAGGTNCAAGLSNALALATSGANTNGTTIVVFASDGFCNTGANVGPVAANLGAAGAIVHSVAVGTGSNCTTNGGTGSLNQIPQNGGSCFQVPDPGNLPSIIQNLIGATLESLEIEVNGGGQTPIDNADIDPDLPQDAAAMVDYATTVADLGPADHEICVTANGSDSTGGVAAVTQCETIHLLQLTASPPTETNELSEDDEHTVFGQILGGTGPVRDVTFTVVSGPNATTSGMVPATPGGPAVNFVYNSPQTTAGLGTDTIQVCTVIAGMEDCIDLTKEWVDTIPPEPACTETVNPHGKTTPPAGNTTLPGPKGGQNEDGFYELSATDNISTPAEIVIEVIDSGSGTVFGPFAVGDKIKYTEAPGATPGSKKIGSTNGQASAIAAHITGSGDPVVKATDFSGNMATVSCLVPPPPK